jgi:hypothetical protein
MASLSAQRRGGEDCFYHGYSPYYFEKCLFNRRKTGGNSRALKAHSIKNSIKNDDTNLTPPLVVFFIAAITCNRKFMLRAKQE